MNKDELLKQLKNTANPEAKVRRDEAIANSFAAAFLLVRGHKEQAASYMQKAAILVIEAAQIMVKENERTT